MDYKQLWDRWVALTILSEADRKDLIEHLHEEVMNGVTVLASLANTQVAKILKDASYGKADAYLQAIAPVTALSALDGYFLSLMVSGINPQTANLSGNPKTKNLGQRWTLGHKKDQNKSYIDNIDPMITLMLERIYDLRVNQALSFHPEIVDLPYKITEKIHQYFGWAVYQGYVIGVMEHQS